MAVTTLQKEYPDLFDSKDLKRNVKMIWKIRGGLSEWPDFLPIFFYRIWSFWFQGLDLLGNYEDDDESVEDQNENPDYDFNYYDKYDDTVEYPNGTGEA